MEYVLSLSSRTLIRRGRLAWSWASPSKHAGKMHSFVLMVFSPLRMLIFLLNFNFPSGSRSDRRCRVSGLLGGHKELSCNQRVWLSYTRDTKCPPPPNHREPTDTEGFHTEDVQQQTIFYLYALLSFFQQFTIFLQGACYTLQALISWQ